MIAASSSSPSPARVVLGVVADDLTGAGDVAGVFARHGVRTALVVGPPSPGRRVPAAEAVVVGLRIRTAPVRDAVAQASASARWLLESGASVLAWKVCSTFDSTPAGNVGPVTDALLDLAGLPAALVCPAYPENGRTVVDGRLLVHGVPLDQTPMREHPLTPMRDADVARLLAPQVARPELVAPLPAGPPVAAAIDAGIAGGVRYLVADASTPQDARALGEAVIGRALPVMASGLVAGLVSGLRARGDLGAPASFEARAALAGPAAIIAGSCSVATRGQVEAFGASGGAVVRLNPLAPRPAIAAIAAARQALRRGASAVLVAASADPENVDHARAALGNDAGAMIEAWLGEVAGTLAADGVRRFIVAGGETSGAVLEALGVRELRVGPELAPGVPILERADDPRILVVAKSGNFGGPDLFSRAVAATGAM